MSEKQELIRALLDEQHRMLDHERTHGLDPRELWAAPPEHPLHGHRERHHELAMKVLELAHRERGSTR
jgi:hypothetical protein